MRHGRRSRTRRLCEGWGPNFTNITHVAHGRGRGEVYEVDTGFLHARLWGCGFAVGGDRGFERACSATRLAWGGGCRTGGYLGGWRLNKEPAHPCGGCDGLQESDCVQLARKWLFARFVAKEATPEKRSCTAADQGEAEQRRFRNPPAARFGAQLVKSEQHECPCVEEDDGADDEGGGEGWHDGRDKGERFREG